MNQTLALLPASNPFARGYDNLHVERLLLITYENNYPRCFRPLHDSQVHLSDDELQLFPCIFNEDFALISEGQSIPDVMGEMLNERHHVGDLYSLEDAQALIRRLSFETGHYSRTWEISTAHLTEEALRYLEHRAGYFDSSPSRLLVEPLP